MARVSWGEALIASFQWLTRLPIPARLDFSLELCRRSVVFYPLVGTVIGVVVAVGAAVSASLVPAPVAAALTVALWIALTGALHLDGLIDTADGLLSHRSRERMLDIMKDSRVGAMGVIVCVLQVLIKTAAVYALLSSGGTASAPVVMAGMVAAPLWSRWFMVLAIAWWPYAREGEGMGLYFRLVGRKEAGLATLIGIALSALVAWAAAGTSAGASPDSLFRGLAMVLGSLGVLAFGIGTFMAATIRRKLGGLTGDTYGAICELLETVILVVIAALLQVN